MIANNAPKELIDELSRENEFEVFEENWDSINCFLSMSTQWRVTQGRRYGLDYNVFFPLVKLLKIENEKKAFDGLKIMEKRALEILSKKD